MNSTKILPSDEQIIIGHLAGHEAHNMTEKSTQQPTLLNGETIHTAFQTKYLFFTGKGGVGKTSIASATALAFADAGKRVLLVSTDPASNLDITFGITLTNHPSKVPDVTNLHALNIDPDAAAEDYRHRVLSPLADSLTQDELEGLREQLSGACTVEIAAFDEFAGLISDEGIAAEYDSIIFDTAPTGHTIRLLSLPKAWTSFFNLNERGASCLGPHSALKNQEGRFAAALAALTDRDKSTVVLVTRPDESAIREAAKTSQDLVELSLQNQMLVINGVFFATDKQDKLANSLEKKSRKFLANLPAKLETLPIFFVPLKSFDTVGLIALRNLLDDTKSPQKKTSDFANDNPKPTLSLNTLASEIADEGHGLLLVMGKGGVGKTTVAAALAVAIAKHGKDVHLATTDPAAHLANTLPNVVPNLEISKIDPKEETTAYTNKILATKGKNIDEDGLALLKEDLASPCTEEVAVFHAFSRIVFQAKRGIIILDTAPTGHTLLLLDAAGSYHKEMLKKMATTKAGKLTTPLMMLQDPAIAKVLLVTLAETTPVSEANGLQEDLRRASIEPYGWVVNKALSASQSSDPVLVQRAANEKVHLQKILENMSSRVAILPHMPTEPIGPDLLTQLLAETE